MHSLAKMKKTIDIYISELLFLHDCVIIPEFGGFVGNNQSAVLNKNTNTIYAPSKEILFNKNLKKNDGLLINHISNSEIISNENAKELVSDYVKNIKSKIQKIRTFRIDKVGLISADLTGNILFLQDSFTNYNPNSFGLSSQSTKKVDKIEKKVEEIIKPISTKTGRKKVWRAAAILLPIIGLSFISITQEDKINEIYSQMANLNPFSSFENPKIISPKQEVEEMKETTTIEVNPIETKQPKEKKEEIIEMNFSVIAGSFRSEKNAIRLVNQLQEQNYNAEIIGTNRNGLIRVCYENFATKEEATSMLHDLKLEGKSSWILSL